MAYVVTGRCIDCCYTDCVSVCPCNCFYRIESPAMLVIEPDACICCGACIPACPVQAIYPEDEVPEPYRDFIALNAERWSDGEPIGDATRPLATAVDLETVHARELAQGWSIDDP